jgi:hypothetical protein
MSTPCAKGALTVCLVGEPLERSGAVPRSGDGSNPSHGWLQRLGWSGSDPIFVWLEGRNMEWMTVLTPLMGPTCHRV